MLLVVIVFSIFVFVERIYCEDDCSDSSVICIENDSDFPAGLNYVTGNTKSILFKDGTYDINDVIEDLPTKNYDDYMEIRPYRNHTVTFKSSTESEILKINNEKIWIHSGSGLIKFKSVTSAQTLLTISSNQVMVGPLEFESSSSNVHTIGVFISSANDTIIQSCVFGEGFYASVLDSFGNGNVFKNNEFHDQTYMSMFLDESSNIIVEQNLFINSEIGSSRFFYVIGAKEIYIRNNALLMIENSITGNSVIDGMITLTENEDFYFYHNLIDFTKKRIQDNGSFIFFAYEEVNKYSIKNAYFYNNIFHGEGYDMGVNESIIDCLSSLNTSNVINLVFDGNILTGDYGLKRSENADSIVATKNTLGKESWNYTSNGSVPIPYYESITLAKAQTLPSSLKIRYDFLGRKRKNSLGVNVGPFAFPTCNGLSGSNECGGYGECIGYDICECELTHKGQFCSEKKSSLEYLNDIIDDNFGFTGAFILMTIVVFVSIAFTIFMVITLFCMVFYRLFWVFRDNTRNKRVVAPFDPDRELIETS